MGSCYSCRSNGGLPTYTTVAMATTTSDTDNSTSAKGSARSSLRSGGSFGFRKRTPVAVKSQSKDRTGELINLENKLGQLKAEDVKNGNISDDKKPEINLNSNSSQLTFMVKTQISGLPRPQVPVIVEKRVGTVEAMQISADDVVADDENQLLEADSGFGNSFSLKTEGDTETLAEVEQIEGDTASISSKGRQPSSEKTPETQMKVPKPSGIARYRFSSSPVTATRVSLQQQNQPKPSSSAEKKPVEKSWRDATSAPTQSHHSKIASRKVPLAAQLTNKVQVQPTPSKPTVRKGFEPKKQGVRTAPISNFRKDAGKWEALAELRQKENITPEIVEVLPINLPVTLIPTDNPVKNIKDKTPLIESILPPSNFHESMKTNIPRMEDSGGSDLGPYSPPSEKDFFLIDDEIADQPALINCQQIPINKFELRDSGLSTLASKLQSTLSDMNEEGGLPAMAHIHSSPVIRTPVSTRRRTSHSVDTLSPCSSLGSDDLMMDFERLDDACQSRPLSEVFADGFQLTPTDAKGKEQFIFNKLSAGLLKSTSTSVGCDSGSRRSSLSQKSNWIAGNSSKVTAADGATQHHMISPESTQLSSSSIGGRRSSDETVGACADGSLDLTTYRNATQDITNIKTLLFRLKRVLQEAETTGTFNSSGLKNGLISHSSNGETSGKSIEEKNLINALEQENADLRRQVVYLQQQMEDKDRTIRNLQQQMRTNVSSYY
ncbi:hypothetical protein CHUAL_008924 [Chamberlinius hualienensis]